MYTLICCGGDNAVYWVGLDFALRFSISFQLQEIGRRPLSRSLVFRAIFLQKPGRVEFWENLSLGQTSETFRIGLCVSAPSKRWNRDASDASHHSRRLFMEFNFSESHLWLFRSVLDKSMHSSTRCYTATLSSPKQGTLTSIFLKYYLKVKFPGF